MLIDFTRFFIRCFYLRRSLLYFYKVFACALAMLYFEHIVLSNREKENKETFYVGMCFSSYFPLNCSYTLKLCLLCDRCGC
jgi:hypothetical protein